MGMWASISDSPDDKPRTSRVTRGGAEHTERLPLARSVECVGTPSHNVPGHEERIRSHREAVARQIRLVRRWHFLRSKRCVYGDIDLPQALRRCVECGAESVADYQTLAQNYGWRPAGGRAVTGAGCHTAHAYVCGDCNGLRPPGRFRRSPNGAVSPSDVA